MRLFSAATIKQAKKKSESPTWAANWQALQHRVEAWQSQGAQVPVEAGGWIHNYVCPDHWQPLTYDGNLPDKHMCPEGHVLVGEKYDAAWRVWRHRQLADLAREAGMAYQVLGSESGRENVCAAYAETAVSILNQYADFYTRLDGRADAESWMLTGHAFNQALTEALWAVPLIHAYDLVVDTLTTAQQERLKRDLWEPLTAVITRAQDNLIAQDKVESNYMAWLNVTLGCLGFALNDTALVDRAIEAPAGFKPHLEQAIWADGLEYEATPYYHNFVLLADLILAEAAKTNGIDLYSVTDSQGQSITSMGCAFAQLAWPDGSIVDLGDGSYWQDSIYDSEICQAYEILNSAAPEPLFAAALSAAYTRRGAARDNWAALLYGASVTSTPSTSSGNGPSTSFPSTGSGSTFLKESGIAILRSEKELAALVPFGPYRGSHHHFDRLSLTVWPFSKEAGCPLYGLEARRAWYPHSYAHNTLVVDGQSHAQCGGELLDWTGHSLYVTAPDAYPGVHFDRTTKLLNDTIWDELAVQSNKPRTFDWVFHLDGDVTFLGELEPLSGTLAADGPASFITLQAQKQIDKTVTLDIAFNENNYRLTLAGERPFTLLIGKAPGTSRYPQQPRLVLIGRTIGVHQRYRTTIEQR
ncbi:MAG: heparinase II/III family protein [Anaerolineae bacterium]|nr:heparinase II/III family protein [Anaerolineae bacterium]